MIEGQRGTRDRREVAVDVEDDVGRLGDVHADVSAAARRHDGRVGLDATVERVQGGDPRPLLSGGPYRQEPQISLRNNRNVQRIGSGRGGNVAAALLQYG